MGNRPAIAAAALAGASAAVIALAACGGSAAPAPSGSSQSAPPRSAAAVVTQMTSAVRAATSVHVTGTLSGAGGNTVGLNVGLLRSGAFSGTVTQAGVTLTIINAGGKVYILATRAFLTNLHVPAAVCSVMCGKYVAMSGTRGSALAGDLNMPQMLQSLTGKLPAFTSAGKQVINGQRAQLLNGADGSTLAVAATGTPYPIEAISPRGGHGRIGFSEWNRVPPPAAPPASQVIDLSKLGG